MNLGGAWGSQAKSKDISLSRKEQGASCEGHEKCFSPHSSYYIVYVRVYNTGKFVWSFTVGTYYKVGELAHTLKCVSNKNKNFGIITFEYASFC